MKQREILLCKYGEIVLKGANRKYFEDTLAREIKRRAKAYGYFDVRREQSTLYIEPKNDDADFDGLFLSVQKVFGIVTVARAAVCDKNIDEIRRVAAEYIPQFLEGKRTFKVEGKRSDKSFPYDSPALAREIGATILSTTKIKVDVHNPDVVVRVEIREFGACISAGAYKGACGMPVSTNGKGLLLLSGGIDSPVAGYMMAKRGVTIEAVHFESFPYTSERAREKVLELASILAEYAGEVKVHVVSLTHIQEELVKACQEDYFTLLLRRYMMTIAERVAKRRGCMALITGESLGQVASQTMQALGVTDNAVSMPVFRPCIGMDKEEIITISRNIGTFDISILPYEDCCTVFTPKHPRTRPELAKVVAQEEKIDVDALTDRAFDSMFTEYFKAEF